MMDLIALNNGAEDDKRAKLMQWSNNADGTVQDQDQPLYLDSIGNNPTVYNG